MVKQKVVIKLFTEDKRNRTKALKAAAGLDGIIATSIDGDKIVVEGDGIDSVELTTILRKKLGNAELISVATGDEKKKEEKEKSEGESKLEPVVFPPYYPMVPHMYPQYVCHEVSPYSDSSCSIM